MTPDRYSRTVTWSPEDEEFVALSPEFPGLSGVGESPEVAVSALSEALDMAISLADEQGEPLPEPLQLTEYSGQFRVRLPRALHARLAREAEIQNTSLNSLVVAALAERLGEHAGQAALEQRVRGMVLEIAAAAREMKSAVTRIESIPTMPVRYPANDAAGTIPANGRPVTIYQSGAVPNAVGN